MIKNLIDILMKKTKGKKKIKYYYSFDNLINENLKKKYEKKNQCSLKKKNNLFLKKIYRDNFSFLVFLIISIYIPTVLAKNKIFRKLEAFSEITLTIPGNGIQKLLSDSYSSTLPEEIIINGNTISNGVKEIEINLNQEKTNVTLRWTSELTTCKEMFRGLSNIIHVDLTGFDPSNIEDLSFMFDECKNIQTIKIEDFNSPNLKNTKSMFNECHSLKYINFKNIDTQQVTTMENMFSNCLSITSIDLSSFNTASVINFNSMFRSCTNLKYLSIDNFNTNNVEESKNMFLTVLK